MVKQIIKRIIVGVSVALILSLIYSSGVFAEVLSPYFDGGLNGATWVSGGNSFISGSGSYNTKTGIWVSITGLPNRETNYTLYGAYVYGNDNSSVSYNGYIYVLGHNTRLTGSNADSVLSNAYVVSSCFTGITTISDNKASTNTISGSYYCTGIKGFDYYTIVLRAYQNNGVYKGLNFNISYEDTSNIETILQEQNQTQKEIKDALTNDTPPSSNDVSSVVDNKVQENTTISDMVMAIPNIIGVFGTTISGSCSTPYNFGKLYNTDIVFNCIDPSKYLGNTIWSIVDIIFCIAVIVPFSKWVINAWNKFTSLKEVQF